MPGSAAAPVNPSRRCASCRCAALAVVAVLAVVAHTGRARRPFLAAVAIALTEVALRPDDGVEGGDGARGPHGR